MEPMIFLLCFKIKLSCRKRAFIVFEDDIQNKTIVGHSIPIPYCGTLGIGGKLNFYRFITIY